jgi:hypothetical protein
MTYTIPQTRTRLESEVFDRVKPVLDAVQEIVEKAGPQGIPSGHLYAMLMGYMDLDTYQTMIGVMVKAGGVTLKDHVLRATA